VPSKQVATLVAQSGQPFWQRTKQHEEGKKRLAAAIWVTNLNRGPDMLQKGS
jgi:hypothetical protein